MQFDLTVTNGMPSVARVSATLARVSSSPLSSPLPLIHPLLLSHPSHPSLLPQALSFICLSPADSLHPSLHLRPSLHPPSLSPPWTIASCSLSLPSFRPFSPVSSSVCVSASPLLPSHSSHLRRIFVILSSHSHSSSLLPTLTSVYSSISPPLSVLHLTFTSSRFASHLISSLYLYELPCFLPSAFSSPAVLSLSIRLSHSVPPSGGNQVTMK